MKFLRLSRESKILLSMMFLAAAALIWVNYFLNQQNNGPAVAIGGGSSSSSVSSPVASGPGAISPPIETSAAASNATPANPAENSATTASTSVEAIAPAAGGEIDAASNVDSLPATIPSIPDAVAATAVIPAAARELEFIELPFLITEPPLLITDPLAEAGDQTGAGLATTQQRASINPFSPIVLQAVEEPVIARNDIPQIVEVAIPAEPPVIERASASSGTTIAGAPSETVVEALVTAPLRTFTPPTPVASVLPRPLPSGTLPVTPEILRTASQATAVLVNVVEPNNTEPETIVPEVIETAAIRLPGGSSLQLNASTQASGEAEEAVPSLLALGAAEAKPEVTAVGGPLEAGVSPLTRYLRDNNVRFTGYVIGPVGVGIFRSNLSAAPTVLPIGQSLPGTDIVLTSLEGKEAEFTQANETTSLILDFRR